MEYTTTFTKIDPEKKRVFGWAYVAKDGSGEVLIDKQGDFIDDPEELEAPVYAFVMDSRRGDAMHFKKNVAHLIESMVFTPEKIEKMGLTGVIPELAWWTGWQVTDDDTWSLVKSGKFKGFSIGGVGVRENT